MHHNTHTTKKKLTWFFVVIVFFLILIFGAGFLGVKFFSDKNQDADQLLHFTEMVESRKFSPDQLKRFVTVESKIRGFRGGNTEDTLPEKKEPGMESIEYLVLSDQKEILDSHILHYESDAVFYEMAENFDTKNTYLLGGYVIKNTTTPSGNFVFFKTLDYPISSLFSDAFKFLLLDLVFCVVVYFIGRQVIARIFRPVEENIEDMKNFVHNAGHELKTPITVMDSNLQLLMSLKKYDAELYGEIKSELANMNEIIESLVNLSDISSLKKIEKINLKEKVEEIVRNFSSEIESKNINTTICIEKNTYIEANRNYVTIFLSNIIKNAIKYNIENGKIDISFLDKTLKITDTGIGISQENIKKIFDRFYREESARNKEGYGIGLSLVKKIADVYDWKIRVQSVKGQGTDFKVRF